METTHTIRRLAGLALAGSLALSGVDELDQQIDEGAEEGEDGEG